MLSGSFQNLLNMGGLPSGLNNAVAGVANDYGYGAEIDDGGFRMFPSEKRIQERQEKIKGQQLEADILEQFNKSRTNPGGGLVNIPGMAIGNMQGLVAQGQGNFNIMNPFTYGNMNRAVEGTRAGDENIQYSDSPAGKIGEAANERNRLIQQLLEGS